METIKFDCHSDHAPAYSCNKSGDNSGEYVRLETAKAMHNLIIDLHATLRAIDTRPMDRQATEVRKLLGI